MLSSIHFIEPETSSPPLASSAFDPRYQRRVFVNRALRMDQVHIIGFDMDYTLALYNQPQMDALSMQSVIHKLIQQKGYPAEIRNLPYDMSFAARGLVIDRHMGNVLKIDRYGYVSIGYHGTRLMHPQERETLYEQQRIQLESSRFAFIDTLFALPEAVLFSNLVDFLDKSQNILSLPAEERLNRYNALWQDVRACMDEAHRDNTLKSIITANISSYIHKDPALPATLHRLRCAGKRLFLLTNSGFDYTQHLMSFLLDNTMPNYPSWQHYFDLVIVESNKPTFFKESCPFLKADGQPLTQGESLKRLHVYKGGNAADLQAQFRVSGDHILYVGDHIYGDMLRVKKSLVWRTAMIIQELERELDLQKELKKPLQTLEKLERRWQRTEAEFSYQQALLHTPTPKPKTASALDRLPMPVEKLRVELYRIQQAMEKLEHKIQQAFNPLWGPLFKTRAENSLLSEQVKDYACIYTSRVSNLLSYSPFYFFRPPREHLPHERVY